MSKRKVAIVTDSVANLMPEARSVGAWLRHGWFVALAYIAGFSAYILWLGWRA